MQDDMEKRNLKELKQGEFFKLRETESSPVWVRDYYERSSKKYWVYRFDDVNRGRLMSGKQEVYTDFIF